MSTELTSRAAVRVSRSRGLVGPRGRTNQGDFGAGMGKSERRGKTRRSGADDGDVAATV